MSKNETGRESPRTKLRRVLRFMKKTLNIGNIAYHENAKLYGRSAYMDAAELALVKEMVDDGVDVFIQMIPADKVIKCKSLF